MAITKQHEYYEKRLEKIAKEMPYYVIKYVDDKWDIRSPLTLFNYLRDFKEFFSWLIAEGIVDCQRIKDIPIEALANLSLDDANNYFKSVARKKYKVSKKTMRSNKLILKRLIVISPPFALYLSI